MSIESNSYNKLVLCVIVPIMFFNIFATVLLVVQLFAEEESTCKTPSGETGECILLKDCPVLFDAFTNPRKEDVEYLKKFMCSSRKSILYQGIWVCCGTTPIITLRIASDLSDLSDIRACGYQHRDDYFSEDHTIAIDEFPWLAALIARNYRNNYNWFWCGGVLINERYVLTSAVCAQDYVGDFVFVRFGEYLIKNDTNSTTDCVYLPQFDIHECSTYEDYYIEERIEHPFYQFGTGYNDVALIKLNRSVTFTDYIRPICLPIPGITLAQPNDTLYVTGLGDTQQIKKKIETTVITDEECKTIKDYAPETITKNTLCTQDNDNAEKTYYGDQGGPSMFRDKRHQWHIEGILLEGTLYYDSTIRQMRVSRYLPWIQDNMKVCYIKNSQDTFIKRFC